jgi:hypothetical protein
MGEQGKNHGFPCFAKKEAHRWSLLRSLRGRMREETKNRDAFALGAINPKRSSGRSYALSEGA